ncbi:hypothetical protein BKI52_28105 [marine bacterium AO1-C]|nr:hypothetical protein BKI52_28105 [marine bacterium AO1-C]
MNITIHSSDRNATTISPIIEEKFFKFSQEQYKAVILKLKKYLEDYKRSHPSSSKVVEGFIQIIDKVLLDSEFLQTIANKIKELSQATYDYNNVELTEELIKALEQHSESTELGKSLRFMTKQLDIVIKNNQLFATLKTICSQIVNSSLDEKQHFVLLMLFNFLQEAPKSGYIGEQLTHVRAKVRDDERQRIPESKYSVNIDKVKKRLQDLGPKPLHPISKVSDLFSMKMPKDYTKSLAPTAMIGQTLDSLRIISFKTSTNDIPDVARFCKPDEILISVHHASWGNLPWRDYSPMKCAFQLRSYHANILSCYEHNGSAKVYTINNPQDYYNSQMGEENYPPILLRPQLPRILSVEKQKDYWKNIKTWIATTNTFSKFPSNHTKSPLVARNLKLLQETGDHLINAMMGDKTSKDWLDKNGLYCSEMVFTAFSLGLHYPMNETFIKSRSGIKFTFQQIAKRIKEGGCTQDSKNKHIKNLKVGVATDTLRPIEEVMVYNTRDKDKEPYGRRLAVEPMSAIDLLDGMIQMVIPRRTKGEQLAKEQGNLLLNTKFLTDLKSLFPTSTNNKNIQAQGDGFANRDFLAGLSELFANSEDNGLPIQEYLEFANAHKKEYKNYFEFRQHLKKPLQKLREKTTQQGGKGVYVPPSAFVIRATQDMFSEVTNDVLRWQYIGHCLHKAWLD